MLVERLHKQTDDNLLLNYSYILGMYLGDGEVSKVRNVYRLRVFLDYRYPNIIQRCADALQVLLVENKISVQDIERNGHMSYSIVGAYYADFPQVFPQHGVGMKYTRDIVLADWQQRIVDKFPLEFWRGLFHSDGSRFINRVNGYEYSRYQFSNVSTDIIKMFCDTCDRLSIHWTTKSRPGKNAPLHDVYISKRKAVYPTPTSRERAALSVPLPSARNACAGCWSPESDHPGCAGRSPPARTGGVPAGAPFREYSPHKHAHSVF